MARKARASRKRCACLPEVLPAGMKELLGRTGGVEGLKASLPKAEEIARAAAVHDAMADPLRLGIMHMLSTAPLCVCVIKAATGVEDSKLSYHLNILRRARLIGRRKDGSFLMYELTGTGRQWLSACFL